MNAKAGLLGPAISNSDTLTTSIIADKTADIEDVFTIREVLLEVLEDLRTNWSGVPR